MASYNDESILHSLMNEIRQKEEAILQIAKEKISKASCTLTLYVKLYDTKHYDTPNIVGDEKLEIMVNIPLNHKGIFKVNRKVLPTSFVKKHMKLVSGEYTFEIYFSFKSDLSNAEFMAECVPPIDTNVREIKVYYEMEETPSVWPVKFTTNEKNGLLESISFEHDWSEHIALKNEIEKDMMYTLIHNLRNAYGKSEK